VVSWLVNVVLRVVTSDVGSWKRMTIEFSFMKEGDNVGGLMVVVG